MGTMSHNSYGSVFYNIAACVAAEKIGVKAFAKKYGVRRNNLLTTQFSERKIYLHYMIMLAEIMQIEPFALFWTKGSVEFTLRKKYQEEQDLIDYSSQACFKALLQYLEEHDCESTEISRYGLIAGFQTKSRGATLDMYKLMESYHDQTKLKSFWDDRRPAILAGQVAWE